MAPFHLASAALLGLLAGGTGCASRTVPQSYPRTSAASPEAAVPAPAVVTRAVDADPPMPGTSAEGGAGQDHSKHQHGPQKPAKPPEAQQHDHGAHHDH
jgi:hypothetical protein